MLLIKLVFHKDKTQVQTPTHTKSLLPTLSSAQISLSQHLFGPPFGQFCPARRHANKNIKYIINNI